MLADDWATQIEDVMEQVERLSDLRAGIEEDPDLSGMDRQQLLDQIAQYQGDALQADDDDGVIEDDGDDGDGS